MAKKKAKPLCYAVARGREVGIFDTWPECEAQVHGFSGARFKGFHSIEEARQYIVQLNWDYKAQLERSNALHEKQVRACCGNNGSTLHCMGISQSSGPQHEYSKSSHLSAGQGTSLRDDRQERVPKEVSPNAVQRKRKHAGGEMGSIESSKRVKVDGIGIQASAGPSEIQSIGESANQVRTIEVYTDGACINNGKVKAKAGYGVYWPESRNERSDLFGKTLQICPDVDAQLVIYSDSKYSIKAITELQIAYRRNDWKKSDGSPAKNKDLIRKVEQEMRRRPLRPILIKVRAHNKDPVRERRRYNGKADKLAVEGREMPKVEPGLRSNLEPADSDNEGSKQYYEHAIQTWMRRGRTREQAERIARPRLQ